MGGDKGGGDEEGEGEGVCVCVWASEDNRLPWFHMHGKLGKGKGKGQEKLKMQEGMALHE